MCALETRIRDEKVRSLKKWGSGLDQVSLSSNPSTTKTNKQRNGEGEVRILTGGGRGKGRNEERV
jgi:hypothetical protein